MGLAGVSHDNVQATIPGLKNMQPVYLCDANGIASYRAARILKKNGYQYVGRRL